MVFDMADCNRKIAGDALHSPNAEENARRTSDDVRLSAKRSRVSGSICQAHLPVARKVLPAEVDDAILKLARVLARQAARDDHARQHAGSARHDETRSHLREIFHRPAE